MRDRERSIEMGVVALTALVVLAGCNAFVPGDTEPTPPETVTPVPVETPTPTAAETPRPTTFDWLVENGSIDTKALFDAHTASLSNRSFTLYWTRTAVGGEGPTADSFDRVIAVENNSTFSRLETGSSYNRIVRTYADPNGYYRLAVPKDGPNQTVATAGGATSARTQFALLGGSIVDLVFVTDDARVTFGEREGTEYALLFSTTPPDYLRALYGDYSIENFSATVWVHPDRYIRTVYYEFTLVNEDERIEIGERYTYSQVGETTVEKPAWIGGLDPNVTVAPAGNETGENATVTPTQSASNGTTTTAAP